MLISLEMGRLQIGERMVAARAGVPHDRIRRNLFNRDEFKALSEAYGALAEAPIFVDDTPALSVMQIRARARQIMDKHGLSLIAIDYLQLVAGPDAENRQVQVARVSRDLKALARELEVPVVVLSQLNRQPEGRSDHKPRMADLRESGAIEQDADVVMMLHREDYYQQYEQNPQFTNIGEVILAKQRNGPTGTIELVWDGPNMTFKNKARTEALGAEASPYW